MSLKTIIGSAMIAASLSLGVGAVVVSSQNTKVVKTEAAVSKTVTRVYIEDQVTTTPILAIESISFAEGYDHTAWRAFLISYLGARSSYTTTAGTTMPSTKGWSYMSNSEQEKYLLCPSGSKNFTMVFPEWVTAFSYKAVGNSWYNWFDVNGSAVGLHSGWGIGKKVNSYIYNSSGWQMNANLDDTAQTNTWGDITISAKAIKTGTTTEIDSKSITMSKYYKISGESYDIFGYTFGGWYTTNALSTQHTSLLTSNATIYAKQTQKTESYLAGTFNSWNGADPNYLMSPAENSQYTIDLTLTADTEFKVVYNGNWYGWTDVDSYSSVVGRYIVEGTDPDSTGKRIKVATTGKYEIYFKTTAGSNRIWIQQDSESEATTWAQSFLDATDSICSTGGTSANHLTALQGIWTTQKSNFEAMTSGAKGKIATGTGNATIIDAHDRYVHIMGRYGGTGGLTPFTDGPTYSQRINPVASSSNNAGALIAIVASVVAISSVGLFFIIRKKKHN